MKGVFSVVAIIQAVAVSAAAAQQPKVLQGPAPKWILPAPDGPQASAPKDALLQIRYADNQVRLSKKGQETYVTQRFKILRPEALQAANLRFVWLPSSGQIVVHSIRIHRGDGTTTEMLGKSSFQFAQREENLEQSILTGLTTAVFAIPGVEVGDEIEFSTTITQRDPTLADRPFGFLQLPAIEIGGTFRARLIQADGVQINRKMTADLEAGSQVSVNSAAELVVQLDNPKSMNRPEGAPARFQTGRLIEYSSFSGWREISSTFWKHYEQASKLAPQSPVRTEIAKIAGSTTDPEARALAALKLVQDRIRYVYVGLGTGNYTPATADQTWERRYGDCKGKTALLLAILKELGVNAEAVLVNQGGLDGIGSRLASPGLFDHILVRANVGGTSYWLDGTSFNSPKLAHIPQPRFRSALPLRQAGAELEDVPAKALTAPEVIEIVDIDASDGADKPAHFHVRHIIHGEGVAQVRAALSTLAGDDLKRALREVVGYTSDTTENEVTGWAYDDDTGSISLKWSGTRKLNWDGDTPPDRYFYLPGAGFSPPADYARPKEQDQSAPWALAFPEFRCFVTTMKLPPDQGRLRWTYSSRPVDRVLGGIRYFRQATLRKGIVQTIMSKRSLQAELTAAEAKAVGAALADFDNEKSYVFQHRVGPDDGYVDDSRNIVDSAGLDWLNAGAVCQPPQKK